MSYRGKRGHFDHFFTASQSGNNLMAYLRDTQKALNRAEIEKRTG
ncbi:MAG: hypothetical protein VSS75_019565 [Candidatus Parabeggiatoa sp.]|nr:hypothetical protein [Candidatus Parabeggiatoa sp.]